VEDAQFDAVLMDIQMPRLDGLAATKEIRAWEAAESRPPTPVIAMTAHAMAGDADKSVAAGMDDHVTKPINPDRLFAALSRAIRPRPGIGKHAAVVVPAPGPANHPTLPAELPGIDVDDGLRRLGGNTRLYRDILVRLATDFADAVAAMEQLVAAGDLAGASRLAHSLKGVAGNVGARQLAAAAAEAEASCAPQSGVDCLPVVRAIEEPLRVVVNGLAVLRRQSDASAAPAAAAGSVAQLPAALQQQLHAAAASADIDRLGELVEQVAAHDAALATELRRLIDNFEYEALQQRLDVSQ